MTIDIKNPIAMADGDSLRVSLQAHVQPFRFYVTQYESDGSNGRVIYNSGKDGHEWVGSDIRGSRIKICVGQRGNTAVSQYEILAQFRIERASGQVDDLPYMRVAPGLAAQDFQCRTLQFQ